MRFPCRWCIQLLGSNLQLVDEPLDLPSSGSAGDAGHRAAGPAGIVMAVARSLIWVQDNYPRLGLKVRLSILTDLSQPNSGVTMLAPGSNQLAERIEIPEGATDPANAIEPLLNPGDCVIFEYRTWHAGAPNFSELTRKAVMIGYCYRWLKPMDFVKQDQSFLEKLSDIEKYLVGEEVDDTLEFQPQGGVNPLNEWCAEHGVAPDRMGL